MYGWLYLIKNGDLYKIGITRKFKSRMVQLKPDKVLVKLYTNEFKQLERELHKRYKSVRIPQTEYFRLNRLQIKDLKKIVNRYYNPLSTTIWIFLRVLCLLIITFLVVILLKLLIINELQEVFRSSFHLMGKISFGLSLISLIFKSDRYYSFLNEFKFRFTRLSVFILFACIFRFTAVYIY